MRHLFNVRRGCWAALSAAAVMLASTAGHATPPFLKIKGNALRGVSGALPVFFATRPSADGSKKIHPGGQAAPASIRFKSAPTAGDLAALRALGVVIPLRRDGTPRGRGNFVLGRIPASALLGVAALPRVAKVSLDGPAFRPPRPLDGTTREVQATDAWRTEAPEGGPLTGRGITVCDIDSGVDVFHPLFFRADGGHFEWEDRNGDERFTAGVDAVDLDGDGITEVVQVLNSAITSFFSPEPRFGSEDPSYAMGLDWLYVDTNGSGAREYGRAAGFDDTTPTFGERLLVPDDVDGDGELDVGEKLVALGSSKIKAVRIGDDVFRRDVNLVDVPVDGSFAHGTGASAVMMGGNRGYNLKVGIAPDAELVMASELMGGQELEMADFCVEEGARVVLHEYAPWQGYHLDGSSDLEEFIDDTTATGVSHINPAGNLSTSQKLYKHLHPAGEETVIDVEAPVDSPYGEFTYIGLTVLWRDASRDLQIVLEDPTGVSRPMPATDSMLYDDWNNGALKIYAERAVSSRGTVKLDMYLFTNTNFPPPIPLGTWKVRVTDPTPAGSPDLEVIGYAQDELSGWAKGIHFPSFASEDHLIGYPGTADHGLAISAYTGHDYDNEVPGQRAYYSGRGHRIDGEKILSIAGPDNPITGGVREGSPAAYFVYGGTSGASPHVAGAAALLLQADPTRTGRDVREAIRAGALVDDVVGVAPNDDFGYGKLRIYKSLYGVDPPGGAAPTIIIQPVEATAGVAQEVELTVKDADEPLDALSIDLDREYDGTYDETIDGPSFTVMYSEPGVYFVKVRVTDATGREDASLAKITVVPPVEPPPDPVLPPRLVAAGGGGCATTPGGAPAAPALALAAIAILGARRRRQGRGSQVMASAPGRRTRTLSGSLWAHRAFGLAALVFMTAAFVVACGAEDSVPALPPPSIGEGGGGASPDGGDGGSACAEGSERECQITISEHNGVLTCLDGAQQCTAGVWGLCGGGRINRRAAPSGSAAGAPGGDSYPKPISLSNAGPCIDNPCDPSCQSYDENPDGGITPPSSSPWSVGDINALPDSIYQQGNNEPCTTGEDCQFDQYCDNPARAACSHDPCAPGAPLLSTCNPCVEEICAADPTCCQPVYGGDCAHDPCTNGASLEKGCDPCVTTICDALPGCCVDQCAAGTDCPSGACMDGRCTCTTIADCPAQSTGCSGGLCHSFWAGSGCASQVTALCGGECPVSGNWTAACAARVETDCAAVCLTDPGCAHDKCYIGKRLNGCADPCVTAICAADPLCCSGAGSHWGSSCVEKVATVCNEVCPVRGNCVSWQPTQTNPLCAGVDLTVGVPCSTTIPVCNRGNTVAPAGIPIAVFPPGSELASCAPAGGTVACTTAEPIAPGECVSVAGCTGLADGVEIMVNPPGAAAIEECHCENNWSVFWPLACQSPSCTGTSNVSLIKKVSMLVALDKSASMGGAELPIRWTPAIVALKAFFQDPDSAGLGVALRFWPHDTPAPCSESPACQPVGGGGCATPLVPLGTLTTDLLPMDAQEQALFDAMDATSPSGPTPMSAALDGAETWAINRKLANPDEEVAVVFITDGLATHCDTSNSGITALAANAYQNFGVRTHFIGIVNANATQGIQIAQAGGGAWFFIPPGESVGQNLLSMMLAIRGDAIPCDLSAPVSGGGPISVEVSDGMGTTLLAEVPNLPACGSGWYHHPTDPTLLKLCPATCTLVRNDPDVEIVVSTPCEPLFVPLTYTQTYQGLCPPGTQVQWGSFTYDTATPGDSSVQFSVRTAGTEAGLTAATFALAQTAQLTPDTQVCEVPGPPLCSVDLYTVLGDLPEAARDWLELQMVLNPTSAGTSVPTVNSWDISYSCPPAG